MYLNEEGKVVYECDDCEFLRYNIISEEFRCKKNNIGTFPDHMACNDFKYDDPEDYEI